MTCDSRDDLRKDESRKNASRQTTAGSLVQGILRIFLGALQNHLAGLADFLWQAGAGFAAGPGLKSDIPPMAPCRAQIPAARRRAPPNGSIGLRIKRTRRGPRIKFLPAATARPGRSQFCAQGTSVSIDCSGTRRHPGGKLRPKAPPRRPMLTASFRGAPTANSESSTLGAVLRRVAFVRRLCPGFRVRALRTRPGMTPH